MPRELNNIPGGPYVMNAQSGAVRKATPAEEKKLPKMRFIKPPTTSAERQAAALEALRAEGGRRISLNLPADAAAAIDHEILNFGVTQTHAVLFAIYAVYKTKGKRKAS